MGKRWVDFTANGYDFKIIQKDNTDGLLCKFRVMPEAAQQKVMVVGTIFTLSNGKKYQVSSCEFNSDMYSVMLKGTCVLQLHEGQPLYGTSVFYS